MTPLPKSWRRRSEAGNRRRADAGVNTGPLINEAAVDKVEEHIADVLAGGGKVVDRRQAA